MATKWNDLKHKASPEQREQLKREAVTELDTLERYVTWLRGRLEVHTVILDGTVDLNSLIEGTSADRMVGYPTICDANKPQECGDEG